MIEQGPSLDLLEQRQLCVGSRDTGGDLVEHASLPGQRAHGAAVEAVVSGERPGSARVEHQQRHVVGPGVTDADRLPRAWVVVSHNPDLLALADTVVRVTRRTEPSVVNTGRMSS